MYGSGSGAYGNSIDSRSCGGGDSRAHAGKSAPAMYSTLESELLLPSALSHGGAFGSNTRGVVGAGAVATIVGVIAITVWSAAAAPICHACSAAPISAGPNF